MVVPFLTGSLHQEFNDDGDHEDDDYLQKNIYPDYLYLDTNCSEIMLIVWEAMETQMGALFNKEAWGLQGDSQ